ELPVLVSRAKVNEKAVLEILRNGKKQTIKVEIKAMDGDQLANQSQDATNNLLGLVVNEIPQDSIRKGVVVSLVSEGPSADVGIMRGDVISQINGEDIHSLADFNQAITQLKTGEVVRLLIQRGQNSYFVAVPLKE